MRGRLPRLREGFYPNSGMTDQVALHDNRGAAVGVDGTGRIVEPNRAVPLDADVFELVVPKRNVVGPVIGRGPKLIRVVDIVILEQSVGTACEGQHLAHVGPNVAHFIAGKRNVGGGPPDIDAKKGCGAVSSRIDVLEVQKLVVIEFDKARAVVNAQSLLHGAGAREVLESQPLNTDIALAADQEERSSAGVGAQVAVIQDDLIASTRHAGKAAAAPCGNTEVIRLEGDVVPRS